MTNPIMVFVVPARFALTWPQMPVGVISSGQVESADPGKKYRLLLLDDNQEPPSDAPCAVCANEPLRIVVHNNSSINARPSKPLWGVTSSTVCKKFSHHEGDPVFVSIRNILMNGVDAQGEIENFVRDCRDVDIFQALNGLAAICEIELMDPEDNVKLGDLTTAFLHGCPEIEWYDEKRPEDMLSLIRRTADELLGTAVEPAGESSSDGA